MIWVGVGAVVLVIVGVVAYGVTSSVRAQKLNAATFAALAQRHGGQSTADSVSITVEREGRKVYVQYGRGRRRLEGTIRVGCATVPGPRFAVLPRATKELEGPRGTMEAMAASLLGGPTVNDPGTAARWSGRPIEVLRSTFADGSCECDGHTVTLHDDVTAVDEARVEAGIELVLAVSR